MAELSVPIPAPAAADSEGEESNIISVPTDDNNPGDAPKILAVRVTAPGSTAVESSQSAKGLSWLEAELERMKFDHAIIPNIFAVRDIDLIQIATMKEKFPGGTLRENLREVGRLTARESRALLKQLLSATAYLHRKGIVHRDIRPDSILVASRHPGGKKHASTFEVVLSNFGLALEGHDQMDTVVGEWEYRAPELHEISRRSNPPLLPLGGSSYYYSPKIDVWAIGMTVCESQYPDAHDPHLSEADVEIFNPFIPGFLFPMWYTANDTAWRKAVMKWVQLWRFDTKEEKDGFKLRSVLRDHVLVPDPHDRGSAQECLDALCDDNYSHNRKYNDNDTLRKEKEEEDYLADSSEKSQLEVQDRNSMPEMHNHGKKKKRGAREVKGEYHRDTKRQRQSFAGQGDVAIEQPQIAAKETEVHVDYKNLMKQKHEKRQGYGEDWHLVKRCETRGCYNCGAVDFESPSP